MAKNIEMNVLSEDGTYEIIYPSTIAAQIPDVYSKTETKSMITNMFLNENIVLGSGVTTNFTPTSDDQIVNKGYVTKLDCRKKLIYTTTVTEYNASSLVLNINSSNLLWKDVKDCTGLIIEWKNVKYWSIPATQTSLGYTMGNYIRLANFSSMSNVTESMVPILSGQIYLPRDNMAIYQYAQDSDDNGNYHSIYFGDIDYRISIKSYDNVKNDSGVLGLSLSRTGSNYYTDGTFNVYLAYENRFTSYFDEVPR